MLTLKTNDFITLREMIAMVKTEGSTVEVKFDTHPAVFRYSKKEMSDYDISCSIMQTQDELLDAFENDFEPTDEDIASCEKFVPTATEIAYAVEFAVTRR